MKKVLILTDSLGAPRSTPELLLYENTYTYKVKKLLEKKEYDVHLISQSGLTSVDVVEFLDYYLKLYNPEILILHFGIVDCAPRAFTISEIKIANKLRLGFLLRFIGNKYHFQLTKIRTIKRVNINVFKINLIKIKKLCNSYNVKYCNIPILKPCSEYLKISYNIGEIIKDYNKVIADNSNIVEIDYSNIKIDDLFMSDKHHLNVIGSDYIYNEIKKYLRINNIVI